MMGSGPFIELEYTRGACYPPSVSQLEKYRRAAARQKGDPLGLLHDPEGSQAVARAAEARFFRERTQEAFEEWRAVIDEIDDYG